MDYLDFFATPIEQSDFDGSEYEGSVEWLFGNNYDIQHLEYNVRNEVVLNAYCCPSTSRSIMFLYLGEQFSDLIDSMICNINRFNESNVQRVWPLFFKAYKNAVNHEQNKIGIAKIEHYDNENIKYYVTGVEKGSEIDFWDYQTYWNALVKLSDYTYALVEEVLKNNGDMPFKETLNIYAKQFRFYNRASRIGGLLDDLI